MKIIQLTVYTLLVVLLFSACGSEDYLPKPRTYPRVIYPEKSYQTFDKDYCTFSFEQPAYTSVEQSAQFFGEKTESPCWFDIVFKDLNGKIHCSYVPIDNADNALPNLVDDSYNLVYKHTSRANAIKDEAFSYPEHNAHGMIFELTGQVASPYQFYITDSVNHYVRGSLYFNSNPNQDSMRPVINFVKEDLLHMIETLEWN